ncbi:hypothetical protein PRNP1_009179 [Phytophthora ramorum]
MTPPADGDSGELSASAAVPELHTPSNVAVQPLEQLNEASTTLEAPEMSSEEEADEMVEALEDLILEAYNNMQIDGEYIFLPDEVAEKLHRVAEQMKTQVDQESVEEEQTENNTSAGEDSSSGDGAISKIVLEEVNVPQQQEEAPTDRPEPEQEQEQEEQQVQEKKEDNFQGQRESSTSEDEEARLRKVQALQAEAAELREEKHKQRIPRVMSTENLFTELAPVPEIDESASSGPPSPSPPHSRAVSGANTPKPRVHTPTRGHGRYPPPPLISLSSTPSSAAASPDQIGKSPASRTPDQSGGNKRKGKVVTYEKRREAALKLREDKKKRELRIRESARKQREDAKRQLEEVHQKEMEEKRERVRRIREERLHRRTEKATGAKGTSKKDE